MTFYFLDTAIMKLYITILYHVYITNCADEDIRELLRPEKYIRLNFAHRRETDASTRNC
jgi:hypothetical protein